MNGAHLNDSDGSDDDYLQDARSYFSAPVVRTSETASSNQSVEEDTDALALVGAMRASLDPAAANRLPLIPADFNDVHDAMENFVRVFESRYGENHPFFTPVSFHELYIEVQSAHHSVRKPALIYLHDDNSIATHVFCTQVLCATTMVEFINSNFTLWPWDFTLAENRTKMIEWAETLMGHQRSLRLRVFTKEEFPILLVLSKVQGTVEIVDVIRSNCDLESILCQLITTLEVCHDQLRLEAAEDVSRTARERMKSEQEAAFQESLEADKLKQKLKIEEEREKERKIKKLADDEAAKEKERKRIEQSLEAEPDEKCGLPMTKIRIKLPNGEFFERRFLLKQAITQLFDFMTTKNYPIKEYKVYCNFPKREITAMDSTTTFEILKFGPRELVVVENI